MNQRSSPAAIISSKVPIHALSPCSDHASRLIGTTSERRMLRIVARYADEWDVPGTITPAAYRAKSQRLAAYCRDINRDPREIRHCVSTAFLIGRNERVTPSHRSHAAAHATPPRSMPLGARLCRRRSG